MRVYVVLQIVRADYDRGVRPQPCECIYRRIYSCKKVSLMTLLPSLFTNIVIFLFLAVLGQNCIHTRNTTSATSSLCFIIACACLTILIADLSEISRDRIACRLAPSTLGWQERHALARRI